MDQDARQPRHHACAIDNGDAEIKIKLEIKLMTAIRIFPELRRIDRLRMDSMLAKES
jgi:hypothetical protein